jgi:hypothetical protein
VEDIRKNVFAPRSQRSFRKSHQSASIYLSPFRSYASKSNLGGNFPPIDHGRVKNAANLYVPQVRKDVFFNFGGTKTWILSNVHLSNLTVHGKQPVSRSMAQSMTNINHVVFDIAGRFVKHGVSRSSLTRSTCMKLMKKMAQNSGNAGAPNLKHQHKCLKSTAVSHRMLKQKLS